MTSVVGLLEDAGRQGNLPVIAIEGDPGDRLRAFRDRLLLRAIGTTYPASVDFLNRVKTMANPSDIRKSFLHATLLVEQALESVQSSGFSTNSTFNAAKQMIDDMRGPVTQSLAVLEEGVGIMEGRGLGDHLDSSKQRIEWLWNFAWTNLKVKRADLAAQIEHRRPLSASPSLS